MSTTILRVKAPPGFSIDGAPLVPAALADMPLDAIARLRLRARDQSVAAGDLFDISRSDAANVAGAPQDAPALVIEGDARWLVHLAAGMAGGHLTVRGAVGDYAGAQMTAGTIAIDGDAGDYLGCEMRGGRLTVAGRCGDFAAGARAGEMEGMTGGTLAIAGNAGERLGDRMRRGLVLVGGDCGDYAASRLVAGSICVAGRIGAHYGYGMRRGTLVLARRPDRLPETFVAGGRGFDVFWSLFVKHLATEMAPFSTLDPRRLPARYAGDLAVDGRGEILIAA